MKILKKVRFLLFFSLIGFGAYYFFINQEKDESIELKISSEKKAPSRHSKQAGFNSLTKEVVLENLEKTGSIPSWIKGTLYLTGPSQFEVGNTTVKYWYNALSMLHAFSFDNDKVGYRNAMIRGEFYKETMKRGKYDATMAAYQKKPSIFSRLGNVFKPGMVYDNANLSIWQFKDRVCALTETPDALVFDKKTLATKGILSFSDKLEGHMTTAFPLYDPETEAWYNIMTQFGTSSQYTIYKLPEGQNKRQLIANITTKNPSYMRTFAMTKNYVVLIEIPFIINPLNLLLSAGSFIENLTWKPKEGTTFTVINKHTGQLINRFKSRALFAFNVVNAQEKNNDVEVDMLLYKNPSVIQCTQIPILRSDAQPETEPSYLHRFNVNLKSGVITDKKLSEKHLELPIINNEYSMKDYTYCYGMSSDHPNAFPHQLIKMNIKTGKWLLWHEEGCFTNKPAFIKKPSAKNEDDGIIMAVIFDAKAEKSFLLLLDAKEFKEVARIQLPHHIPLGASGRFIENKKE